jgi:hypothetical protein
MTKPDILKSEILGLRESAYERSDGLASTRGFMEALDSLRNEIDEETQLGRAVAGLSVVSATGLSIGYVVWIIRGGVLLSSLLSSMPAWRLVDPLPVVGFLNEEDDEDDEDSLDVLIEKGGKAVKAERGARHGQPGAGRPTETGGSVPNRARRGTSSS